MRGSGVFGGSWFNLRKPSFRQRLPTPFSPAQAGRSTPFSTAAVAGDLLST